MSLSDNIKDRIECEWSDEIVDRICDLVSEWLESSKADLTWTLERLNEHCERLGDDRPTSLEFYAGLNAGIQEAKILLEMVKTRNDGY